MYDKNLNEESLKVRIYEDVFLDSKFGKSLRYETLGKVDFAIKYYQNSIFDCIYFLWAEAKKGRDKDIIESLIKLILTIGKEKTFSDELPPAFLGAFDCEKIAFVEWHEIQHIFSQNDFNWNVTPSNHESKEFKQLYSELKSLLDSKKLLFYYDKDSKQLQEFIESNFVITNKNIKKIQIDKNNFIRIYLRWLEIVKPSIDVKWELEKPEILESDFYLADVLSRDNSTQEITKTLRILLQKNAYRINLNKSKSGRLNFGEVYFKDKQKAHTQFWNLYERPPLKKYWDYMIERRDLLVPKDIREYKGAFFTPQIWVYKAQEFLAKTLGENFQDDYYIWDLAAGTGNLLVNLSNAKNIFASTIDTSDVNIMKELADKKSLDLLENHIFQFDFLNDCFFDKPCPKHKNKLDSNCKLCKESKVPKNLQHILQDSKKRKKLIIFINPPYAEAGNKRKISNKDESSKPGVATNNRIYEAYKKELGNASNEVFVQFFFRIYKEISGCILASFSTLKYVNSSNFIKFRENFKAKFLSGFICPSYTFDNVNGHFPIGFLIWNLDSKDSIKSVKLDVFYPSVKLKLETAKLKSKKIEIIKQKKKKFESLLDSKNSINKWLRNFYDKKGDALAILMADSPDFQSQNHIAIINSPYYKSHMIFKNITQNNLIPFSVYFAVRLCIKATWLNDRDQFLEPKTKWIKDCNFHNDCLAFMLFCVQNRVSSLRAINHFIPFSEAEIKSRGGFDSDFMYKFINGKIKADSIKSIQYKKGKVLEIDSIESNDFIPSSPLHFSPEALAVFNAGREIFKYYHAQDFSNLAFHYDDGYDRIYNPNASLYDIKAHFQGFSLDSKGNATKMNALQKCLDSNYANLANALNIALDELAKNIESKVYEYEFLLE